MGETRANETSVLPERLLQVEEVSMKRVLHFVWGFLLCVSPVWTFSMFIINTYCCISLFQLLRLLLCAKFQFRWNKIVWC